MPMDSFTLIISIFIAGYGVYGMYGAIMMNKTGFPPSMLVNSQQLESARDVEGFSKAMYKPFFFFNVILILDGVIGLANYFMMGSRTLDIISIVILGVALVVLGVFQYRSVKKYLR